jgi:hypothetical protein
MWADYSRWQKFEYNEKNFPFPKQWSHKEYHEKLHYRQIRKLLEYKKHPARFSHANCKLIYRKENSHTRLDEKLICWQTAERSLSMCRKKKMRRNQLSQVDFIRESNLKYPWGNFRAAKQIFWWVGGIFFWNFVTKRLENEWIITKSSKGASPSQKFEHENFSLISTKREKKRKLRERKSFRKSDVTNVYNLLSLLHLNS